MGLDDGLADRQSEAEAVRLGGEKRLEQVGELAGVEADTAVDHLQVRPVLGGADDDLYALAFGRQAAPGVDGVLDQVEQDLLDLRAIGENPATGRQAVVDVHGWWLGQHADDQMPRFAGDRGKVDRFAHRRSLAREMANALDDAAGALRLTGNLAAGFADRFRRQLAAGLAT